LPGFDHGCSEAVDRVLRRFVDQGTIVGGVLAVTNRGGDSVVRPFGSAGTVEQPEPTRSDHRFLLTSVTKHFVTAQVLQLVEAGEVDLETPMAMYLPEFGTNGKERVTIRQLMTHTSGMDLTSNSTEVTGANLTAREHIRNALEAQLAWQPDTWFEYNSPSYWVLAEMITQLTGLHYTDHLMQRITGPLQMHDTKYETGAEPPERYVPSHGYRSELSESNRMLAYPSGGLVSSAGDLLRFGRCLLNGGALDGVRVLGPRAVQLLRRPYVKDVLYRGRKTSWGLGWQLGGPGDLRSERTLFQWGASGTAMWVDHDAGLSVVLLTATWLLDWRIYGQIVNAVYGAMPDAPSATGNV
jgi:CubicO group peptidase (beta-lactamase class C family)